MSKGYDRDLGMGQSITRRDFLNGVAVTVGGSMLPSQGLDKRADPWFGYNKPDDFTEDQSSVNQLREYISFVVSIWH